MRVAVAVRRGSQGTVHFGYADSFEVWDVDAEGFPLGVPQLRDNAPHCDPAAGGDPERLEAAAALIGDCDAVITAAAGPCARRTLGAHAVVVVEHRGAGVTDAQPLLAKVHRYVQRLRPVGRVHAALPEPSPLEAAP